MTPSAGPLDCGPKDWAAAATEEWKRLIAEEKAAVAEFEANQPRLPGIP